MVMRKCIVPRHLSIHEAVYFSKNERSQESKASTSLTKEKDLDQSETPTAEVKESGCKFCVFPFLIYTK